MASPVAAISTAQDDTKTDNECMTPLEIPALPDEAILLCEVGSTAHGTGIDGGEDHDEIGVVIESASEVFGLGEGRRTVMQRTQPEGTQSGPGDIDRTLHSLRRFLKLSASGNPSILMVLWSPIEHATPLGLELRALAPAFLGRHIIPRYRGYMQGQAQRLLGKRGSGGRPELIEKYGYDTKYAMHCARLGFQCQELLFTEELVFPIQGEPGEWLRAVRYGDVPFSEWWERVLHLDGLLGEHMSIESIAEGPDVERIVAWSEEAHRRHWQGER